MRKVTTHTIQVFEHQTLRVGDVINGIRFEEATFKALALYQEKQKIKYFSLVYNGIKFSHYVGIIQIGRLTLEILPKADKNNASNPAKWQKVLIEMLSYCQLIKVETLGIGQVQLSSNRILDLYFSRFINKINQLLIKGLPKIYLPIEENLRVLKGRLNLPKQLRKNQLHPERFFVQHTTFSHQHLFNQVLQAALRVLAQVHLTPSLKLQLQQVLAIFPKLPAYSVEPRDFDLLFQVKKYQPYRELLEISRLILFNFSPDIRNGQHHLFALLFDMNKLFEEYVFRRLKLLENDKLKVQRQTAKPFWQRRMIRPDLVFQIGDKKYVLDTKWKVLNRETPSMEDLRQLYIYCQYFNAEQGVLFYPNVHQLANKKAIPFQPTEKEGLFIKGQILFGDILEDEGNLNKRIGQEILDAMLNN